VSGMLRLSPMDLLRRKTAITRSVREYG